MKNAKRRASSAASNSANEAIAAVVGRAKDAVLKAAKVVDLEHAVRKAADAMAVVLMVRRMGEVVVPAVPKAAAQAVLAAPVAVRVVRKAQASVR